MFDTLISRIALILRFFLQYGIYNFQIGYTFLTAHEKNAQPFGRNGYHIWKLHTFVCLNHKKITAIPELSVRPKNRGYFLD